MPSIEDLSTRERIKERPGQYGDQLEYWLQQMKEWPTSRLIDYKYMRPDPQTSNDVAKADAAKMTVNHRYGQHTKGTRSR